MIKIAFFDIDGTILEFGHADLTNKTKEALIKLQENGVLICMATGRSYPYIPHFNGIDFDIYLTFNGSYVVCKDKVIRSHPIDNDDRDTIISNLKRMNRAIAISNVKNVAVSGIDPDLKQYFDFGNVKLVISDNFDDYIKEDIFQIMCSCSIPEREVILKGTKNVKIAAWWDKAIDIIPKDGGKGQAISEVLAYFGFKKEEAIAFGDGQNDIDMFNAVGISVAMGNAPIEVKEKATAVCKPVNEDGVYNYCLENHLI